MKLLQRFFSAVGILFCLAGLILGSLWIYRSGWLAKIVPAEHVASPVNVRLYGPTTAIRGDFAYFTVAVEGDGGTPVWKLIPATSGALSVTPDGKTAQFRSLDGGVFSIFVSVAGKSMQVASDHIEFENLDLVTEVAPEPEPELPPELSLSQALAAMPHIEEPPPAPTVSELTLGALENVASEDRAAESRVVAGCIRSVIGRIETGLMAPDADPMLEVERQAKAALGQRAEHWELFLQALGTVVESLRAQGEITTAASAVPTLSEMSGTLLQAK